MYFSGVMQRIVVSFPFPNERLANRYFFVALLRKLVGMGKAGPLSHCQHQHV